MADRRASRSASKAPEFPFRVNDYVPHLVAAIHQFRDAALNAALRDIDLNVGRYRVLGVVSRFAPCSMTELANFTAIDRTTLTRNVDLLVEAGYVEREAAPKDRRQVMLTLTDSGQATYRRAVAVLRDYNASLMRGVDEGDAQVAARVLQAVVHNLAPNPSARDSILRFQRPDHD
ncbi:MAG TPA: MarR family transcriptional regulator [Caulobacteraceae bacterium]|jgi:DNA-binding MarR family transcriptional regulator